ncbi:MAG: hypothetical protein HY668_01480 [Chloroflexi bacterium]|nr:hypothetical protein [Chloroflexota bacterium]
MAPQFFSKEIEVTVAGDIKVPVAFSLDGRQYEISEIVDSWHDYGYGKAPLRRKRWWHRHHRTYYRVKTAGGQVFEIYHDRGTSLEQARRGKWFLYRRM